VTDADLAIVVNFGAASLIDERFPNGLRGKTAVFTWPGNSPNIRVPYPELVNRIIELLHRVHFELGPGFFHHVYRRATMIELRQQGIGHQFIQHLPVYYHDAWLGKQETRLILVEDKILLAAIAVQSVDEVMKAQLRTRLRRQNASLGILVNFNSTKLDISLVR
jgi:GxxExxY protein